MNLSKKSHKTPYCQAELQIQPALKENLNVTESQ